MVLVGESLNKKDGLSRYGDSHSLMTVLSTVGDRTVALNIIARCPITQTPTGQSKVW